MKNIFILIFPLFWALWSFLLPSAMYSCLINFTVEYCFSKLPRVILAACYHISRNSYQRVKSRALPYQRTSPILCYFPASWGSSLTYGPVALARTVWLGPAASSAHSSFLLLSHWALAHPDYILFLIPVPSLVARRTGGNGVAHVLF